MAGSLQTPKGSAAARDEAVQESPARASAGDADRDTTTPDRKRRCTRCARNKKGCDGETPCGRCAGAGLDASECIEDMNYSGPKRTSSGKSPRTTGKSPKYPPAVASPQSAAAELSTNIPTVDVEAIVEQESPTKAVSQGQGASLFHSSGAVGKHAKKMSTGAASVQETGGVGGSGGRSGGQGSSSNPNAVPPADAERVAYLERQRQMLIGMYQPSLRSFESEYAAIMGYPSDEALTHMHNMETEQARQEQQMQQARERAARERAERDDAAGL